MENQNRQHRVRNHPMRSNRENQARKPYRSPRLRDYGDLTRLTAQAGKGETKNDSTGNPSTKLTG